MCVSAIHIRLLLRTIDETCTKNVTRIVVNIISIINIPQPHPYPHI